MRISCRICCAAAITWHELHNGRTQKSVEIILQMAFYEVGTGRGVEVLKVWATVIDFPNPETEPDAARACVQFCRALPGLYGVTPHVTDNGCAMVFLTFPTKEQALSAKWKLEEFTDAGLPLIKGKITERGFCPMNIVKGMGK